MRRAAVWFQCATRPDLPMHCWKIVTNVDLQRSMGAHNRRRIEEEFDWRHSLDRMESVYERVLSEKGALTAHSDSKQARV